MQLNITRLKVKVMLVFFFLALGIGAIWALQPVINAGLARSTGPLMASTISFLIGSLLLIISVVITQWLTKDPLDFAALSRVNPVYYMGGAIGAAVVLGMTTIIPKLGAGGVLSAAITGQLIMAAIIDHFGLLGAPRIALNSLRLIGIILLLIGVNLVIYK
ncbi:DMT family transporter [Neomoorella thermoacetica]|uniref:Inner membrane protein YdcZ n=2 Tax=Neomoorella thermoacetica TaxID=1525 RepID=Q2RGM8_MOOTA|nr:DMT family transporter [Moorella thermoacetica]